MKASVIAALAATALLASGCGGTPEVEASVSSASATPTQAATKSAAEKAAEEQAAKEEAAKAAADKAAAEKAAKDAAAKAAAEAAAADKEAKALTDTKTYAAIDKRALAKVVRDPDAYVGKKYVVFGEVTQYDSATGTDGFLANVAYKNTATSNYGYFEGENAVFVVGAANFDDIVEEDIVKMYVTVVGSYSYDTQIGGNTTVPQFEVNVIKRVS